MEAQIDKVTLIKDMYYESCYKLNDRLLEDIGIEVIASEHLRAYLTSLRSHFYSLKWDKHEIKYPSNWWEAFKERWLPWTKVKYTKYVIEYDYVFPELQYHIGDKLVGDSHVTFQKYEGIDYGSTDN